MESLDRPNGSGASRVAKERIRTKPLAAVLSRYSRYHTASSECGGGSNATPRSWPTTTRARVPFGFRVGGLDGPAGIPPFHSQPERGQARNTMTASRHEQAAVRASCARQGREDLQVWHVSPRMMPSLITRGQWGPLPRLAKKLWRRLRPATTAGAGDPGSPPTGHNCPFRV